MILKALFLVQDIQKIVYVNTPDFEGSLESDGKVSEAVN